MRGRRLALLAAALAVPAMAADREWRSGDGDGEAAVVPMPFETPGQSFPGSAFYYLADEGYIPPPEDGEWIAAAASDGAIGGAAVTTAVPGIGPVAAPMIAGGGADTRSRALKCMTMAIYYEAASEADAGQRAVAQVVLNRVAHRSYPNSVCGVVFQGSERRTGCQFSFTCDGSLRRQPSARFWSRAHGVALAALGGAVYQPVGLATHYHTTAIYPYWAPSLHHLGTIGAHRFYSFRGGAGRSGAFRFAYAGYEPAAAPRPRSAIDERAVVDPIAVAKAYEVANPVAASAPEARSDAASTAPRGRAMVASPPPEYSDAVRERGGDALFRGEKLPGAGAVKPEYATSGQWLNQPGKTD